MTSSTEDEQRPALSRRQRVIVTIVIVSLALAGGGWLWHRHGTHNIFDAIMKAEWSVARYGTTNPALDSKYKGALHVGASAPGGNYRQRLQYWSRDDTVSITIEPDHSDSRCAEDGCATTWWKEKTPTELYIFYSESIATDTDIVIEIFYNRHTHSLHQQAGVYQRHEGTTLSEDEAATVLSEHGITGDYLRQKRDWLLYEKVLPDFLAANPGVNYTAHDWGWVTVTEDRLLTS